MTKKERKQMELKWERIEKWWNRPLTKLNDPRPTTSEIICTVCKYFKTSVADYPCNNCIRRPNHYEDNFCPSTINGATTSQPGSTDSMAKKINNKEI